MSLSDRMDELDAAAPIPLNPCQSHVMAELAARDRMLREQRMQRRAEHRAAFYTVLFIVAAFIICAATYWAVHR